MWGLSLHLLTRALTCPPVRTQWGGTIIESWSDNATNAKCGKFGGPAPLPASVEPPEEFALSAGPNPNTGHGVLFNAMIHPYTVGPMAVSSFTWVRAAAVSSRCTRNQVFTLLPFPPLQFQGESNSGAAAAYACQQPAMISSWRTYFNAPNAGFYFVELEPWIGPGVGLASFRTAQLAALALPVVGYAIGTDIGDPLGALDERECQGGAPAVRGCAPSLHPSPPHLLGPFGCVGRAGVTRGRSGCARFVRSPYHANPFSPRLWCECECIGARAD